jgi:hypothetical protein
MRGIPFFRFPNGVCNCHDEHLDTIGLYRRSRFPVGQRNRMRWFDTLAKTDGKNAARDFDDFSIAGNERIRDGEHDGSKILRFRSHHGCEIGEYR